MKASIAGGTDGSGAGEAGRLQDARLTTGEADGHEAAQVVGEGLDAPPVRALADPDEEDLGARHQHVTALHRRRTTVLVDTAGRIDKFKRRYAK